MKKKMMFFALFIMTVVFFSSSVPVVALNVDDESIALSTEAVTRSVTVDGFAFEITEYLDENYRLIMAIERQLPAVRLIRGEVNLEEARALLRALGKNDYMISLITDEQLAHVAMSGRAYASLAYMTECMMGETHYIKREDALSLTESTNEHILQQHTMMQDYGMLHFLLQIMV
ncbi:MAG: hypothetical protein FWC71_08195 [Defluviitaleaceae bacterium]|nr:hypothetical protein [Defluviitaleaceae bacterium]